MGAYTCWNCGWTGAVKTMKEYKSPPPRELVKLSDSVIGWFSSRGISNQTLLRYRVSEGIEYMPQTSDERRCILFNYFIGDTVVNIKYRDRDKNFKLVSGAQLSLYGLDVATDASDEDITIVEGEMDVLSFYEAGVKNAVSVPNGASKGDQKLEWLEDMLPYLTGKRVHLATDNDLPGLSLRAELARRLGKENCFIVTFPEGCKDANEVLLNHGAKVLKQCYVDAEPFPIEGIEMVDYNALLNLWDDGYPKGWTTGWEQMDQNMQWMPGRVTLITGIPGNGKSTFLKNLLMRLSDRYGLTYMMYSAEEASATMAASDLLSIKTGKSFFSSPLAPRISREEVAATAPWVNYHFKYYSLSENESSVESILAKAKEMIRRVGINGLVIDNMSTIERQFGSNQDSRHNAIGNMMRDLRQFARENDIHIWLVAHPKKMTKKKDGTYEVPNGYDVGDCYSQDTEVLTEKGWMYHNEWNGERIAMFNMDTGCIEFDTPELLNTFDHDGAMHHYRSKTTDILVTPNHKMVVKPTWNRPGRKKYKNGWQLIESSELKACGFKMPSRAMYAGGSDDTILEGYSNTDLAELCGYYTSEGTLSSNSFSMSQTPNTVLDKMEACLSRMGVDYHRYVKKDKRGYKDSVCIRVRKRSSPSLVNWIIKNCGAMSYGVKVPEIFFTSSKDVRTAYLMAHIDGDGHRYKSGYSIDTTSKSLSDGLQALAISLGYSCSVFSRESKVKTHRKQYVVNIRPEARDFTTQIKKYRTEVQYVGKVYCFTTRTGAYVTRRNGKVSFQGNSSHYYNSPDVGITVHRNRITGQTEIHKWKVRFKYDGQEGVDYFNFNIGNSRYTETEKINDGSDTTKFTGQQYASLAGTV